ncbi:MAG: single-stranded-DNA-specific exonuclease RecJ [Flavobacteriia bacterium]|jgi:single-stranded-DNA-specific exonuclease|nr:single-stranded-DNA-specific exonuclease RecJ [Flavobacteriia bacterium]
MNPTWKIRAQKPYTAVAQLSEALKIPHFVAQLLLQRGIESREQAQVFFKPQQGTLHDPFLMHNMSAAVARLSQAITYQEKVLLYGDYDVDGTTAVALMAEQLAELGLECSYYIPDRYREGYGVSAAGIDYTIAAGYDLLITLDCGIKAHTQLARAHEAQIDIIVCDHHQPDSTLPPGIILNPKQAACAYPYAELSGCGVAFKLLQGLYQFLQRDEQQLFKSLDLVALAIGADIVELLGENRVLCARGLTQLNTAPRPAFLAILALASKSLPLSLRDIVFVLAPRINAAGRIASGKRAVDWMLSTDQKEIEALAIEINTDNTTRRALDQENTAQALAQIASDPKFDIQFTTVVYDPNWHKGVVGIVASRLIETHYRPTIVLTESNGVLTGSARCMQPLNLYELLEQCQQHLVQFGGHQFAAGLSLLPEHLDAFKDAFETAVATALSGQQLQRQIDIDTPLEFKELGSNPQLHFPRILQILSAFEPCGPGNLHPVFVAKNCLVLDYKVLKGAHLKLKLIQEGSQVSIDAIGFNLAAFEQELAAGVFIDIVFQITSNTYLNRTTLQLVLQDLCMSA